MARLELALLGSPIISLDGHLADGFSLQKARALLIYLAVEGGRPHARESLVGLLWPELLETAARTSLRQALANLREAIGDEQAQPSFLTVRRDSMQLHAAGDYWIDVVAFGSLLDACEAHRHRNPVRCTSCARRREQAIGLYRADFLAGFHLREADPFEEWAAIQRERLHRRMAIALEQQAAFYEAVGEMEQALGTVSRQLDLDAWMEEAHRERMRLLAVSGRRSEALAQFEACRRVLAEELGVEPAPETVRLHALIRDGVLPAQAVEEAVAAKPLPQPSTPLVGREREIGELADLLEDPAHRLVTITGVGGAGKTRLALAVAQQVGGSFSGGVAFVPLSILDDAAQIPAAVLLALNAAQASQPDPLQQVLEALRDKEVLIVLDSLEHLLPAAREIVIAFLKETRKATVLITSQERIGVQAELCFKLEGLEVPAQAPVRDIRAIESVQLFLERGNRVNRQLEVDERLLADVLRICRLVEGVPLAIELAASAVGVRTCGEIADGLEADIRSLATQHHDLPARHRSLAAALAHSWNLLGQDQQRVMRRLAVFRGGWDPEAATGVVGASLADLQALSDKSLVRRDRSGRFSLHTLMRQHASEMLVADEKSGDVHRAHLQYYRNLAETAGSHLAEPSQVEWLERLDQEISNFREALSWGVGRGEAELVASLCLALARFWMIRGFLREGQEWIEAALAIPDGPTLSLQARLHNRAGILAAMQMRHDLAEAHLQTSVAQSRALGDTVGEATSMNSLGAMSIESGDYDSARRYLEACLPSWRQLDSKNGLASTLNNLGAVALLLGDYQGARKWFEESLPLFRALGDRRTIAGVLYNIGDMSLKQGETEPARRNLEESLALRQAIGEIGGVAESLEGLATLAAGEGRAGSAAQLFGAATVMRESVGAPHAPVNQGDYDQAVAETRRQLGDEAFAQAWSKGSRLTREQAVTLAVTPGDLRKSR